MKTEKGREEDKEGVSGVIRETHAEKMERRQAEYSQCNHGAIRGSLGW